MTNFHEEAESKAATRYKAISVVDLTEERDFKPAVNMSAPVSSRATAPTSALLSRAQSPRQSRKGTVVSFFD